LLVAFLESEIGKKKQLEEKDRENGSHGVKGLKIDSAKRVDFSFLDYFLECLNEGGFFEVKRRLGRIDL